MPGNPRRRPEGVFCLDIQWYPGHMAKAKRLLSAQLSKVDLVVELCDARLPQSSRNPALDELIRHKRRVLLLCKADLAEPVKTQRWLAYFRRQGLECMAYDKSPQKTKQARALIELTARDVLERNQRRGIQKTLRAMVVGVPNVGKSTFINRLYGGSIARTGDRPGVTKSNQWVKVSPYLEVLDTPGMLWPKFTDEQSALRLAYLGSIRDEIIDGEELSIALLEDLAARVPDLLAQRYKKLDAAQAGEALLEGVCKSRGFILPGGVLDLERGAKTVLDEFRAGKIGRISLERPEDIRAAEPAGEAASAKPEELP